MGEAEAIIADFRSEGWACKPNERLAVLVRDDRDAVHRLVEAALRDLPDGGTFFDAALSFLSNEEFARAIELALERLRERTTSDAAASVIAYASLQTPHLLTRHLRACWALRPNSECYYETWPWRAADAAEISRLLAIADAEPEQAERAWRCLLETRDHATLARAAAALSGDPSYEVWLNHVGFTHEVDRFRALHSTTALHVQFPAGFLDEQTRPPWLSTSLHPTWRTEATIRSAAASFGGLASATCPFCNGALHRLFQFDQAPYDLPIPSPLTVAACLSCLGYEQEILFYKHDAEGAPTGLNPGGRVTEPQFPAGPLRRGLVHLVRLPERWATQDWALSNGRENLNRVGGAPSWIQSAEYPTCVGCARRMPFIAQLDSDLPVEDGSEWLWGSGGIGYIFWCAPCRISAFSLQCT